MTAKRGRRRVASVTAFGALLSGLAAHQVAAETPATNGGSAIVAGTPTTAHTPAGATIRIMALGDSVTLGITPERSYRGVLQQLLVAAGHQVDFVGSYGNDIPPGGEATWFGPDASQVAYDGPLDKDFEGHGGFQAGQPESVVGYRDHMLAQMIPTDLARYQPDVVLVHIGTNDYFGGFTRHGPWHGPGGGNDHPIETSAGNVIDLIDAITASRPQALVLVAPIGRSGLNGTQDALAQLSAIVQRSVEGRAAQGRPVAFVADLYRDITAGDLADAIHPTDSGYAKLAAGWFRSLHPVLAALERNVPTATPSSPAPPSSTAPPSSPAPPSSTAPPAPIVAGR